MKPYLLLALGLAGCSPPKYPAYPATAEYPRATAVRLDGFPMIYMDTSGTVRVTECFVADRENPSTNMLLGASSDSLLVYIGERAFMLTVRVTATTRRVR